MAGHATRVELEIPIPEVCDTYYSVCSKIDHHNRCRQDDLKLEKKLRTMRFSTHVNSALFAMCVVDSWLLYKNSCGLSSHMGPWEFYKGLADGLLDNTYDGIVLRKSSAEQLNATCPPLSGTGIHLVTTQRKGRRNDGTETNHTYQANCVVCKSFKKSKQYCSESHRRTGKEVFVCNAEKGRDCFERHISAVHDRN